MSERVPKLRFKQDDGSEFQGWKTKSLNDIALVTTGSTPSTAMPEYYGGKRLFASPADIERNKYIFQTKTTVTDAGFKQGRVVKKGSVLFVCIGSTIGKVAIAGDDCITNQQINSLSAKLGYLEEFIYAVLLRNAPKIKLLAGVQAVPQINKSDFSKLVFPFPECKEQQKIASFLSAVDEKIGHLERRLELLQTYKRGVMQKLFSQEVRFKREDGSSFPEWQEHNIGALFKLRVGGDISKLNLSKTKTDTHPFPIYANGDGKGLYGFADTFQYNAPAVTVTGRGNLGNAVLRTERFNAIVRLIIVELNNAFDGKFVEEAINNLNIFVESTGVPQLTAPQLSGYLLQYPSLKEQQKISRFLTTLDTKLDAVNAQISQMQRFKKGLLQQMFV